MRNKIVIVSLSIVALISLFLLGQYFYKKSTSSDLVYINADNPEIFVREHSPVFGDKKAKVTLIEFLDPECESCRAFYPYVKNLLKTYEGKVKLVVRYAAFHGNSKEAIAALEAAKKQSKYWEALEVLFQYQPRWGDHHNPKIKLIYEILPTIGIDVDKLKKDMKDPKIAKTIEQDMADLKTLGVRGTPTFFINGRALSEFSWDALQSDLIKEVNKHYK